MQTQSMEKKAWLEAPTRVGMTADDRARWLNERLILDAHGRVLMTHPHGADHAGPTPLSIGAALDAALTGPTATFTMIVAYFAHGYSPAMKVDFDHPDRVVRRELADPADQQASGRDTKARFRLLYGELRSELSRQTLYRWWALCKWRKESLEEADAWRDTMLRAMREASAPKSGDEQGLRRLSERILDPADDLCPFRDGRASVPVVAAEGASDMLLLFLLHRAAEIRCGRSGVKAHRVFHPKLYVVERKTAPALGIPGPDSVVIAGSANWSGAALSASSEANVEVATLHRVSGHVFETPTAGESLGADLASTARDLFYGAERFASWSEPFAMEAPEPCLALDLSKCITTTDSTPTEPVEPAADPVPRDIAQLALAIRTNIELALGVAPEMIADIRKAVGDVGEEVWGGKKPSIYQVDGALRLLMILRHSRGALLSDEPGLGKTLIAQIVVAMLIRDRIRERMKLPPEPPPAPIRVSILAPARVLGKTAVASGGTQWFAHAREIRAAVEKLLELDGRDAQWADDGHLIIRPMTNQSLSVKADASDPEALHHLSLSEIVVLDEAHNFRNTNGKGTRVLRFCLSMPVPGPHEWRAPTSPLDVNGRQMALDVTQPSETPSEGGGRKVLLLTATPFNNRIEDVRTQLGHFAKAMDWTETSMAAPELSAYENRILKKWELSSTYWHDAPAETTKTRRGKKQPEPQDSARRDFQTLLELAIEHFGSSRALDDDDEKEAQKETKANSTKRPAPKDGGPRYSWAGTHTRLGDTFATITRALADRAKTDSTASELEQAEWRSRVDAMLVNHVVQRSRRQVLRMVEAQDPEAPKQMFRAPDQLRIPLPLQAPKDSETDTDTFEADVLNRLFELVMRSGEDVSEDPGETASERLTMMAYALRYERGLQRKGSSDTGSRGARNFVGFQAIGLVKRLQSSPYAFVMTLIRGLLRTCFNELALMDEILRRLKEGASTSSRSKKQGTQLKLDVSPSISSELLTAVDHRLDQISTHLTTYITSGHGPKLVALLGVSLEALTSADRRARFWHLAALGDPALSDTDASLSRDQRQRRQKLRGAPENGQPCDAELGVELLRAGGASKPKTAKSKTPTDSPAPTEVPWVLKLLADLAQPAPQKPGAGGWKPGVAGDLFLALGWLIGHPHGTASNPLIPHVFNNVEFANIGGASGAPMDALATQFRKGNGAKWVEHTLRNDARVADLVAWLLAQTIARLNLERGDPTPKAREEALPAGIKTLVFSEYADTLSYLRTALIALHETVQPKTGTAARDRGNVLRFLADRVLALLESIDDRLPEATNLPAPLPADRIRSSLSAGKTNEQVLVPAIDALFAAVAVLTSRQPQGRRLSEPDAGDAGAESSVDTDAAIDVPETLGADEAEDGGVTTSSALDAFSPWYQIDPRDLGDAGGSSPWSRLKAAHQAPVHTLMATEVLSEGVNLQECGVVVHYDLPWNPTRLIQRNGRVDRRIDPRVETASERLKRTLGLSGHEVETAKTLVDAYWAPRHVYHLTVPPIEPKLDEGKRREYAEKVRQILFAKLSGIREIFGLAAWPIVLEQEQAQEVLDGRLAYETPAFRRREELFVAHETMGRLAAGADPAVFAATGSLLLTVPTDTLTRVHRALAGLNDASPLGTESPLLPTKNLQALGVMAWSPRLPHRVAVRSHIDLRELEAALTSKTSAAAFRERRGFDAENAGLFSVVGWIARPKADDTALLVWRQMPGPSGNTKIITPALVAEMQDGLDWQSECCDWSTLAGHAGRSPTAPTSPQQPVAAPTSAFEAVLVSLAQSLEANGEEAIASLAPDAHETPSALACAAAWTRHEGYWWFLSARCVEELAYPQDRAPVDATTRSGTNLFIVPSP